MNNYLTALYYERFHITERERKLMNNKTWEEGEMGENATIRNDQSISEVRGQLKVIDRLIDQYIEKIKSE